MGREPTIRAKDTDVQAGDHPNSIRYPGKQGGDPSIWNSDPGVQNGPKCPGNPRVNTYLAGIHQGDARSQGRGGQRRGWG